MPVGHPENGTTGMEHLWGWAALPRTLNHISDCTLHVEILLPDSFLTWSLGFALFPEGHTTHSACTRPKSRDVSL